LARKLFFYLLQYQTAYSFRANILMTCTNLLNIARRAGDFAFLETVLLAATALDTTDVVFLNSKAEILKVQGRLQDALDAYDAVINAHPQDAVAQNGRAEVLKAQGRLHEALGAYETVINAHPQDVVAQTGRAEVLKAQGRLQDAIDAYDAVVKAHPQNAVAQNGRAEVLKAQGKLQVALDAYDAVIKAHPQNAVAQNGRAEVLKSQGRLQEALAAYDAVIRAHPQDTFAQNGRLSILILLGILSNDDWEVLLQENPKSENDWIRYHLGCMALIQNNKNHCAIEKLNWGLRNTPYDSDRPYFISALATAYIGAQEYREGLRWLDKLGNNDTSAIASARRRILMAHALFAEEKQAEGIQILNALQSSEYPLLQRAKDALQARYVANPSPEQSRLLDDEIRIIEFQLMVA
jgi:tetratricopeptide (TPR) repeat protein